MKERDVWSRGRTISFIIIGLLAAVWGHYAVGVVVNAAPICEKVVVRTVNTNGTTIAETVLKDPAMSDCTVSPFGFMLMVSTVVMAIGVVIYGLDRL